MRPFRMVPFWPGLLCFASTLAAQPMPRHLQPGERYEWMIRASHTDEILIAAGDSLDIVLLRVRCKANDCWGANSISVTPRWRVGATEVARVNPLAEGRWYFGRAVAGARLSGLRPGRTAVTATLPSGETASDSISVISAPGAVRIVLEPKPRVIVAGDTVRFRVTARDSAGRVVATLQLPRSWGVVGPPDSLGFTPVKFPTWETEGGLVARLGQLMDALHYQIVLRRTP
jgi:hypothetical protein